MMEIIESYGLPIEKNVGLSFETVTHQAFLRFRKLFPKALFRDMSWDLRMLRIVKSRFEIGLIRTGAEKCARLPEILTANFRPGMTELELSSAIENYFRHQGLGINHSRQDGADFGYGICSAGSRSATPTRFDGIASGRGLSAALPFGASRDVIGKNEPILLDYGVTEEGYHVDQTRMAIWGEPDPEVAGAYHAMREIETALMEHYLKPGISWQDVWNAAESMAKKAGYPDEFMGCGTEKVKFVGHGVGLELDEPPFLAPGKDFPLEPGMTIAVEPKVILGKAGVIGIEDTILITKSGAKYLTTASRDWIRL
jgi:Xaa-Pro aminopeptidase